MKKLLGVLLLSLLMMSCAPTRMFYVMQKDYSHYDTAMIDVYTSLKIIGMDSININDWSTNYGLVGDNMKFNQYILLSSQDKDKTHYYMIFTEFYNDIDSTYNYKIRCETKNKKLWPAK